MDSFDVFDFDSGDWGGGSRYDGPAWVLVVAILAAAVLIGLIIYYGHPVLGYV